MLERARGRAVDLGYAAGWGLVKSAPSGITGRAFQAAADAATVRNGGGTRQLRKNLRRVVGPQMSELRMDRLVGDALRSYSRYWLETFRLPRMDHADVLARVQTTGAEHLDAALEAGRGAVVALPHMGNWDVAGMWTVEGYGRFTTVAERLQPESLFDRFVEYRESLGFEIVPLTGGARSPVEVLRDRLRDNGVVCLVADRDLSRSGIEVDFFGEAARMPGGPALLAVTTGAPLLPVALWFTPDGWGQVIHPAVAVPEGRLKEQVRAATQAVARSFEGDIAAHPADWHMLQRLWIADLPARTPRPAQPQPVQPPPEPPQSSL
ncbi:MAG: phosphatidylinositol dimannoside acyltransferase [Pseudonocardiales bacterium]|nr:phosphatidylinositol dimannoside acyltransferase [Pseudonocardiales bacterium]